MNTLSQNANQTNYVYMIQRHDFVLLDVPIYKIGKSRQKNNKEPHLTKRLNNYPKESKTIKCIIVNDCDIIEREIIKQFKIKFTQCLDVGTEYFMGQLELLEEEFDKIINNEQQLLEIEENSNKRFVCEKCGKKFDQKNRYVEHMNRKTPCDNIGKQQYDINKRTCPKCDKILSSVCAMKTHLKTCKKQASSEIEELKKLLLTMNNRITKIESNLK